jgi:hypothetical protein
MGPSYNCKVQLTCAVSSSTSQQTFATVQEYIFQKRSALLQRCYCLSISLLGAAFSHQRRTLRDRRYPASDLAPVGRFGNSGVEVLNGPGTVNLNTALGKAFALGERFKFKVEGSFTKILNHVNPADTQLAIDAVGSERYGPVRHCELLRVADRIARLGGPLVCLSPARFARRSANRAGPPCPEAMVRK